MMCFVFAQTSACARNENQPIRVEDLPEVSQEFLNTHFAGSPVALATRDRELFDTSYDVVFTNGSRIEFDRKGRWTSVDCKGGRVPDGVVPQRIVEFAAENHAANFIVETERDPRGYEIKLNNGIEIRFDKKFNPVEYD